MHSLRVLAPKSLETAAAGIQHWLATRSQHTERKKCLQFDIFSRMDFPLNDELYWEALRKGQSCELSLTNMDPPEAIPALFQ